MIRDSAKTTAGTLLVVLVAAVSAGCPSNHRPRADVLLVNGRIHSFAERNPGTVRPPKRAPSGRF
jgi:hypothetical protein